MPPERRCLGRSEAGMKCPVVVFRLAKGQLFAPRTATLQDGRSQHIYLISGNRSRNPYKKAPNAACSRSQSRTGERSRSLKPGKKEVALLHPRLSPLFDY